MRKVNFSTDEEKLSLIESALLNGEILIEEAILLEEKYLIFEKINIIEDQEKLNSLKPTLEEVEQAEFELKTITLLMEVGLI